jgi:hypothetical protein
MAADLRLRDWVEPAQSLVRLPRGETGRDILGPDDLAHVVEILFDPPREIIPGILADGGTHHRRIHHLETALAAIDDHTLFVALAYQPEEAVRAIAWQVKTAAVWTTVVEIYEAAYRLAADGRMAAAGIRGQRTGVAYLARTRWVLFTLLFRSETARLIHPDDLMFFRTHGDLLAETRLARDDWLAELDRIDDHPRLAEHIDVATDAAALCRYSHTAQALAYAEQADSSSTAPAVRQRPDDIDRAVWRRCVDDHLLTRFRVGSVWRLTWRMLPTSARRLTVTAGALFAIGFAILASSWPWGSSWAPGHGDRFTVASVAFLLGYAAVAAAAVREPSASWPWMLRLPAAASVGLTALTAFTPTWWTAQPGTALPLRWVLAGGLVIAGLFYLLIEAANHTRDRVLHLLGRVGIVLGGGLVHAAAVSVVGLRWAVPLIADDGERLDLWWAATGPPAGIVPPELLVAFATAWSFAFGVFAQILWDDRPVTAPLAHLRWRGR